MGSDVKHILVAKSMRFSGFAAEILKLSPGQAHFYQNLGCFYLNKHRLRDLATPLAKGDYIRFHSRPRRFPVAENFNSNQCIVFEDDELLVVNKPAGLPVHPTLDNRIENLLFQLQAGRHQEFFITHRLDVNTSGLVLLAKNKDAVSRINRWLEEGMIGKLYTAQVSTGLPCQVYVDYMKPQKACPKEISGQNPDDWKECQLEIVNSRPLGDGYELTIRLITGRTHQIRAQLAFHGAPIRGDQLYGSPLDVFGRPSSLSLSRQNNAPIALCCNRLELPDGRHWQITSTFDKPS